MVENFRGIRTLDWHVKGRVVCLLGPGDSTKTTILDAIELALLPRWHAPFSDTDFHKGDVTNPIRIEVTIGELASDLLSEERCGLYLRGYCPDAIIIDDPENGYSAVLTVRLEVGDDLEPHWTIVKESHPEPKAISWRDRERLCMARLGNYVERQLTWARGSSLSKMTAADTAIGAVFALAHRAANDALDESTHADLWQAAANAKAAAAAYGVELSQLRPRLDSQALTLGNGALSLHDEDNTPIRAVGLGSRRLTSLAIQQIGLGPETILLIDEIESGLEPHRIRRLMTKLCQEHSNTNVDGEQTPSRGQVILTTHSPTPIVMLTVEDLRFVKCNDGHTEVDLVRPGAAADVQAIVRRMSLALLARKVLVCEGKTEEGLCRALDEYWNSLHNQESFAYHGVVPVDGKGRSHGPVAAAEFRRLGYQVCFLGDSDAELSIAPTAMEAQGIRVLLWSGQFATEQRIAADLTWDDLQHFIDKAIELRGDQSVLNQIGESLGCNLVRVGATIENWKTDAIDEAAIRHAIGNTAKSKGWFKDITGGEELGKVVTNSLPRIPDSPLSQVLAQLEAWIYA